MAQVALLAGVATSACAGSQPSPDATSNPRLGPAEPELGIAYPYDLYSHCGIMFAKFGGKVWKADDAVGAWAPRPDDRGAVVDSGYTAGTMTMIDADTIVFAVDERRYVTDGSVEIVYHPTTEEPPTCQ